MKFFYSILFCVIAFCMQGKAQQTIVVDVNGKGNFTTIQAALNSIPSGNNTLFEVLIKNGVYKEVVTVDASKNNIHFTGESKEKTIVTFNNHAGTKLSNGDTLNTWTCATVFVYGNNITAENITFENNAGFTAGQAVAVRVEGNRVAFKNCNFIGFQDVLFLSGNGVKHYLENCYIEGTTDFIFGAATAYFNKCTIKSKKNSHVTAASTNSIIPFGFVFNACTLIADSAINKVSLGRPWSPTASVTYINCFMDKHIIAEGWNNWKNPANEQTARYAEYNSYGPGANALMRVKWTKQLTLVEAEKYTVANVLGTWQPFKN
jgi:pectinesterase